MKTAESLTVELQREKQASNAARNLAKRASKETAAIKRAVETLGCKVQISSGGDFSVDIENHPTKSPQTSSMYSGSRREGDDKTDLAVSVTVGDDIGSSNPIGRVCEALCPLRTRDGGCKWPDAGCAQLGSQFVGLKANFDAFDRLSIYDGYFQSD